MKETERLIFRRWQECDAPALFKCASDPRVGPCAGWNPHRSEEESLGIIRTVLGNDCTWAVVLKETGEPVGCIGYLPAGRGNIPVGENEAEVGYWIAYPYWNRGICTEALGALVDYCFSQLKLSVLWGDHFIDNPASGRVMEKCGFEDSGIVTTCPGLETAAGRPVRVLKLTEARHDYLKNK